MNSTQSPLRFLPIILIFSISALLITATISQAGINDGLVAYYPFNGNADDASGNGNHGLVHGATLTPDRFGNLNSAYSFNGVDNYISTNPLGLETGDIFTISFWMNYDWQERRIWILALAATCCCQGYHALIHVDGSYGADRGIAQFGQWGNESPECNHTGNGFDIAALQGKWAHYATVFDANGKKLKAYVNGMIDDSVDCDSFALNAGIGLIIGRNDGSWFPDSYFKGSIDELRIYNRALSDDEILQLASVANRAQFTFSYINSPQAVGAAFPVTITARKADGAFDPRL
jgi:hypothetical protein